MAKIMIQIDTETNESSVQINGVQLEKVYSLSAYFPREGSSKDAKISFEACQVKEYDGGIHQVIYTTASEKGDLDKESGLYLTSSLNPNGQLILREIFKCKKS